MIVEGNNVTNRVEGRVVKVCQKGLFLCSPYGHSGGQEMIHWFGKDYLDEVYVYSCKHGRWHRVGRLREG